MKKIRLAICDDFEYLCINIKNQFKYSEEFDFLGYCTSAAKCTAMVESFKPDILLLDVQLETETAGIDIIPEILDKSPQTKIIMLTSYSNDDYIFDSIINGASDYICKNCTIDEMFSKIKNVYNNKSTLSPEIALKFNAKSREVTISHRSLIYMLDKIIKLSSSELEVLKDLYNGKTYNQIAKERFVEACTVRSMGSRILKKFNATNIKTLVRELHEIKIFDLFSSL